MSGSQPYLRLNRSNIYEICWSEPVGKRYVTRTRSTQTGDETAANRALRHHLISFGFEPQERPGAKDTALERLQSFLSPVGQRLPLDRLRRLVEQACAEQGTSADAAVTQEFLHRIIDYRPETGEFIWKVRDDVPPKWNERFAGEPAGSCGFEGRRNITVNNKTYQAHRLAWLYVYGVWPSKMVDHINGDPSDNRIANLREATASENQCNSRRGHTNKTGERGICCGATGYRVAVRVGGVQRGAGPFKTLEAAVAARDGLIQRLHGDFARQ